MPRAGSQSYTNTQRRVELEYEACGPSTAAAGCRLSSERPHTHTHTHTLARQTAAPSEFIKCDKFVIVVSLPDLPPLFQGGFRQLRPSGAKVPMGSAGSSGSYGVTALKKPTDQPSSRLAGHGSRQS